MFKKLGLYFDRESNYRMYQVKPLLTSIRESCLILTTCNSLAVAFLQNEGVVTNLPNISAKCKVSRFCHYVRKSGFQVEASCGIKAHFGFAINFTHLTDNAA